MPDEQQPLTPPPTADLSALLQQVQQLQQQVAQLTADLENKDKAYKGLQTQMNNANEARKAVEGDALSLRGQVEDLQNQLTTAHQEKQTLAHQVSTLETTNVALETGKAELEQANAGHLAHAHMIDLVSEKYEALLPMVRTLKPGESPEATEQMLAALSTSMARAIEAQISKQTQGYVPGGNFSRGTGDANPTKTPDQLLQEALAKAGTREYDAAIGAYFQALDATGQMPDVPQPAQTSSFQVPQ